MATAGTATAVIAGAAAVGGAVGGTAGAVSGYIDNGAEGAVNGFLAGTLSGAASGAVAASPMGAAGVAASNVAIDVGEYMFEQTLNRENITAYGICIKAGTSFLLDHFEIKFKKGVKLNRVSNPGWLNVKGDLYSDKQLLNRIITREARRVNREYAEKKIARSITQFMNEVSDRLWHYGIDASKGEIKDFITGLFIDDEKPQRK